MNLSTSILLMALCMLPSVHLTSPIIWIQCSNNTDCYSHSTCIHGQCSDACAVVVCGAMARCTTIDHIPICQCAPGYTGNPYDRCTPVESGQSKGSECHLNSDCDFKLTCDPKRNVCVDFCEDDDDICAVMATCTTLNHAPICKCPPNYIGSPYIKCTLMEPEVECPPNACGNNTFCKVRNGRPICSCLNSYIGDPLSGCRHECEKSDECGSEGCCRNFRCYPGPCGPFIPIIRVDYIKVNPEHPCDPDPCTKKEICRELNGKAFCQCRYAPYTRLPLSGCNPECVSKFNCPSEQTCINYKCVDSCPGNCDPSDECFVFNHKAKCRPKNSRSECTSDKDCSSDLACDGYKCVDPCVDYCDPNSDCQTVSQRPICTCKTGYYRGYSEQCYREGSIVE